MVGGTARQENQRHTGRRNGPGQDHADRVAAGTPGVRTGHLGPAPDRGADHHHEPVGDGNQKVVSVLQNRQLVGQHQGAQGQAAGLVQTQRCAHRHHQLQTDSAGSQDTQTQQVLVHDTRRGTPY